MTQASLLCQMMNKHGVNWRQWMKENYPSIIVKDCKDTDMNNPYVLFMYSIGADFKDPLVQESRGIIINETTLEVVCFPFRKFGKHYESYADTIDWKTARVQDKLDGSIIKLWWSDYDNKWVFSSNSMIYATDAYINETNNIQSIIDCAENMPIIQEAMKRDILHKDHTYIFELTSPYNQVVVKYDRCVLYHIGTRNNRTGVEKNIDIGVIKPREYQLASLDDCIEFIKNNTVDDGKIRNCDFEGFVVVDANWNRIKIKNPIYQVLHNMVNNGLMTKEMIVEHLLKGLLDIDALSKEFPDKAHWLKYYDFKVTEFLYRANAFINITRNLYDRSMNNRKLVATVIKNHPLSSIGFKSIGNEMTLEEILTNTSKGYVKSVASFIDDYKPENLSYLYSDMNALIIHNHLI